jgi:hypothetical protein
MSWQTPAFEEINMSAEIGGYQGDYGDGNTPPVASPAAPDQSSSSSD